MVKYTYSLSNEVLINMDLLALPFLSAKLQNFNNVHFVENDKIKVFIEEGQDHHFSKSEEDFQKIPEKYLFEMNPEK